ncbi:MAG: AMP-binding protein, partial [Endozoicomonas sp.]
MKPDFPDSRHCPLRHQALISPGKIAIRLKEQECSFGQLDAMVENCRDNYQTWGLKRGDRLAVMVVSPLDTIVLAFACLRAGWVFSPVNPAIPDQQVQAYCQRIGASLVTGSAGIDMEIEGCDQTFTEQCEWMPPFAPVSLDENDTFSLVATSGTSKAVAHCYRNHYFSALGSLATLPLEPGDSWLLSLPLFHVGGFSIVMRCILSGATMVLYLKETPLQDILEKEDVSHLSLVNTQLFRLLEQGADLYR